MDASHFSMVGFALDMSSEDALSRSATALVPLCKMEDLSPVDTICLIHDRSGGEIRMAFRRKDQNAEFQTMNPAFVGDGRTKVEIVADSSDPAWLPAERTLAARFEGEQTPLIFDMADPGEASKLTPGAHVTVNIAAFSFEPEVFSSEAAYIAAQKKAPITLAPNYFIPSGTMFASVGGALPDGAKRPIGYADFAGKILKVERRANAFGGGAFWWALVQTYGDATIDVLLDPSTVKEPLKVGGVVTGRFWLSARLAPAGAGAADSR